MVHIHQPLNSLSLSFPHRQSLRPAYHPFIPGRVHARPGNFLYKKTAFVAEMASHPKLRV